MVENDELDDEQVQESQALIPTDQDTIIFNGKPLVVVRLPDGRPGVVLRWICENLHIGQKAQIERIKRTEVIAVDLVYVQVQTGGGFQTMATLVLDSVAYWLATSSRMFSKIVADFWTFLELQRTSQTAQI